MPQVRFSSWTVTATVPRRLSANEQSSSFMVRSSRAPFRSEQSPPFTQPLRGGGPGGGCDEKDRSFFNPNKYKVRDDSQPQSNHYLIMNVIGHLPGSERSWKVYSVRGQMLSLSFDEAIDPFSDDVGVRAWKKTRLGIW